MVTMKNCHSLRVSCQKVSYLVTNHKQRVERWSFVILPLETDHIAQYWLIYPSAADVNSNIFVGVLRFEELCDSVDIVAI